MFATPLKQQDPDKDFMEAHLAGNNSSVATLKSGPSTPTPVPTITRQGTYREANVSIGMAAERKGVKVREFDRGDRWLAWRRRAARVKAGMEAKAAKGTKKTKGKKSNKGALIGGKKR